MAEYILVHGIRVAKSWEPETFGRLTTIGPRFWVNCRLRQVCQCSCGAIKVCDYYDIVKTTVKSCGCLKRETTIARSTKHGHASRKSESSTYTSWRAMIDRCTRVKASQYEDYGGRGIKVCDRWLGEQGFRNFLADMGPRPSLRHSIERIDVNSDYSPENCKWATIEEQRNNTRVNRLITAFGRTQTLAQWSKETGISVAALRHRLFRAHWELEKALTVPMRKLSL